jgi:twitching motility two-component system response regulator PilG
MRPSIDLNLILSEARTARRLGIRLALESIAEATPQDEVWLWLAWLSETPADALDMLQKVNANGPLSEVVKAAGLWVEYLNAPEETLIRLALKPKAASSQQQYLATCTHCKAQLAVRESALGKSRSCPGCGTSFTIPTKLPTYEESPQLGQVDIYIPAKVAPLGAAPQSQTILIVDDSSTVRVVASKSLEKFGYQVVTSPSGEDALNQLQTSVPGLVLLDIKMPGLDGYEVCKRIRSNPATRDLPVIMLSGKDAFFDKVRGRLAGCNAYITKPCSANVLRETAAQYVKAPAHATAAH